MKKLLIVMVVALLALALVACGGNWVEISKVDEGMTGLKNANAIPVSYATTAEQSFTNYKFVFVTADGTFQLGEIELFANAQ